MTMLLAAVIVAVMVWALIKKYETRMVLIAGDHYVGAEGVRNCPKITCADDAG